MPRRRCDQCNQPLPRPLAGPGRRQQYCSHACRQKAYRQRGGRASGTTGAQRRRQQPDTGAEIRDDKLGPKSLTKLKLGTRLPATPVTAALHPRQT
jgi:hypothetical protein